MLQDVIRREFRGLLESGEPVVCPADGEGGAVSVTAFDDLEEIIFALDQKRGSRRQSFRINS
ncbi:hypothetical protein N181_31435 [Sinorhizobium fredii USDA 205]|uniref:Uncharacterized protein n=1 Tax=Sinorhizobium glycinis TaxID=1472378 RepID=A0A178YIN2_9HYPH|nr:MULTISPECIES: hypothetical protein [Sinorhizobium]KSV90497.1 hypothetical protein N181_31435 [Sinorhizobium fredii USDA 205]MCK3781317.1 hypothetical protein [Ensifer sesbaniae]OAP47408.1 hypothetical protein AU381_17005 [Sinorhizobium glycinis]